MAAIPAAALAGRRYYATDVGIELWDTGTSWIPTGPALPIGSMALWTINSDPVDPDGITRWLVADGRTVSRATYATLSNRFLAASYPYGAGNGTTTFNIPDTRGRVVAGPDSGVSTGAASRLHAQTISGITNQNTLAGTGGADSETLSQAEMPSHTHVQNAHTHVQNAHTHNLDNTPLAAAGVDIFAEAFSASRAGPAQVGSTVATNQNTTATNQNTGSGSSHNNAQPYVVIHHIIRVL